MYTTAYAVDSDLSLQPNPGFKPDTWDCNSVYATAYAVDSDLSLQYRF